RRARRSRLLRAQGGQLPLGALASLALAAQGRDRRPRAFPRSARRIVACDIVMGGGAARVGGLHGDLLIARVAGGAAARRAPARMAASAPPGVRVGAADVGE